MVANQSTNNTVLCNKCASQYHHIVVVFYFDSTQLSDMKASLKWKLFFLSSIAVIEEVSSMVQCSSQDGGGVCPDKAKCCKIENDDGTLSSGCIPYSNHVEGERTCCNDFSASGFYSGCAGNYKCTTSSVSENIDSMYTCTLHEKQGLDGFMEKDKVMPRYHLVESSVEQLTMFGFPLIGYSDNEFKDDTPIIAYYSNMDWTDEKSDINNRIQQILFVVHGSGRNADDYLYSGMVAANIQKTYLPENVLIIAPRFLVPEDGIDQIPVKHRTNNTVLKTPLLWNDRKPIPHTWRYGANALPPFENISSYDVMDHLVEHFAFYAGFGNRYSSLQEIAVIGHSAGGQFTQRWALTSNSQAWHEYKLKPFNSLSVVRSRKVSFDQSTVSIRAVAANPRSFCYLDGRRYIRGKFQIPPQSMIKHCPTYNTWEWGLDGGGFLPTPYKDRALALFDGDVSKLAHRYAQRNVIYLSGKNDTEILHGSCNDDKFQGKFRRQRSGNFYKSLHHYFGYKVHSRSIIPNVGHDHSLIFGSKEGISAIFGE